MSVHRQAVFPKIRFALPIALATLFFSLLPPSVSAATITVNADCDLADAITAANTDSNSHNSDCTAGSGRDTIQLSGTINLDASLPAITAPVDILGPSGGSATIDGQSTYQIFTINDGVNPTIRNLILQNAQTSSNGAAVNITGGGTISNMQFLNNSTARLGNCIGTPFTGLGARLLICRAVAS